MRKGVECKFCGEDELDDFMELMKETGRRDGFEIRSEEYFRNFLQAFHGNAKLCIAKLDGKVLSGALLVNYAMLQAMFTAVHQTNTENICRIILCNGR